MLTTGKWTRIPWTGILGMKTAKWEQNGGAERRPGTGQHLSGRNFKPMLLSGFGRTSDVGLEGGWPSVGLTQELNLSLLHCQWILYHWAILTTMPQDIIKTANVKDRILKAAREKTKSYLLKQGNLHKVIR